MSKVFSQQFKDALPKMMDEIEAYIQDTYGEHYVGDNDLQTIDFLHSLGNFDTTARDIAIKYLPRFGKKEGYNPKDLKKAIHYILFIYFMHFKASQEPPKAP